MQEELSSAYAEVTIVESSASKQSKSKSAVSKKKQAEEQKAIEKIKGSKAFKKRKRDADESDDDEIARAIFDESHAPLPGQMENCALCSKRFTVTPYSVAGTDGGLLCPSCGRKISKEREGQSLPKKKPPRKQTGGIGSRRAAQSRILDGDIGTKSLATLCVHVLAKNVDMADDLGDLPEHLVDKIARLFSKRRLLSSDTLPLFVRPYTEALRIYDGAKLGNQDLVKIFQTAGKLNRLKIRCAIQFKDEVMDYLISRNTSIESFYLHGANLLSEEKWHEFLRSKGSILKELQVYYTDRHFGDETIKLLATATPNLERLKVENNQKVTNLGVTSMSALRSLKHLGFQLHNKISSEALVAIASSLGPDLQTLSFKIVPDADDAALQAIHNSCRSLVKLRITESEKMTDDGFVALFNNWQNPGLQHLDLQKCRHLDAMSPRSNDKRIGLCSEGFKALMAHSGHRLRFLNVHACRHISKEAFEEVFSEMADYPELRELEISFCEEVTDYIVGCIFRACPNIKEVNVFGCMKLRHVQVPRGVILVGVPNAKGMVIDG